MRLFKYFGPDRMGILQDRLIRFSQPSAFNDPFEFLPYIEAIDTPDNISERFRQTIEKDFSEEYAALNDEAKSLYTKDQFCTLMKSFLIATEGSSKGVFGELALYAQEKIHKEANQMMGVLCLSERYDDLLMWAHYADCHKGFVIEFDSDSPFFNQRRGENDDLRQIKAVEYRKERPAINLSNTNMSELFLTKSEHWEYEKEWRMVVALSDANKVLKVGGEDVCLFEFPVAAIKSIFVGAKMQEDTISELLKNLESDTSLRHLNVFKAKVHSSNYSLVFDCVRKSKN
ncbi:DUF2971 domain-containing protein [Pseudomonas sp. D6002]|uniref:DUF2971 domain-containing protein n=1 Tax=Pseudomonas sp. D6002 TaxID=2738819 RepID=UPI0015A0A97E|nr:DUF2971 domain-containing protein [Pseudomonas sp. D6002]NWB16894.1 DUF2971 domain-containing protein [Pseudomonas sp. D6002]